MPIPPPTISSFIAIAGLIAAFAVGRDLGNSIKDKKKWNTPWLKHPFHIIAYVVLALAGLVAMFNTGGRIGKYMFGGMGMGMGMGMGGMGMM
jgi:hypothetical protein